MRCNTILIIEDDAEIRDSLKELLELEGYSIRTASNGQEGLDALRSLDPPCLILLDLMMPVMNGWEFLECQRGDVQIATIPVVVVSAAGERAKNLNATGFIKKPLDFDALLRFVKQFCSEKTKD